MRMLLLAAACSTNFTEEPVENMMDCLTLFPCFQLFDSAVPRREPTLHSLLLLTVESSLLVFTSVSAAFF